MQKWIAVAPTEIPEGKYSLDLSAGEENGLKIKLEDFSKSINLNFGVVFAVKFLDEGVLLNTNSYFGEAFEICRKNSFKEVLYEVEGAPFKEEIIDSAAGSLETDKIKHYLIITMNYVVEIVTQWEPTINIEKQGK